jgi:indolepyruvate ferredoxin oxidoreductase alpha subunit
MVRSVTRLSHASGNVTLGELPAPNTRAYFKHDGPPMDPMTGMILSYPVALKHARQQEKLRQAVRRFEQSPFNTYNGPQDPELLMITSSACFLYSQEAVSLLGAQDRVGLLKLGTTWPQTSHPRSESKLFTVKRKAPYLRWGS